MKFKITTGIFLIFLMACGTVDKSAKFSLKASNNMYLAIDTNSMLVANQPDSSKAEIFEKTDQGNGKWTLKTSAGKFVTDNRNGPSNLFAILNWAGEWEMFEIISLDETKINIKSSRGKFVYVHSPENMLYANSDAVGDFGTFTIKTK